MKYSEINKDLFTVDGTYYLAHCISADFGMGRGIVVQFNRRFNMKNKLKEKYPDYLHDFCRIGEGDCILEDNVFNLITKERYWGKPTYESVTQALEKCKKICIEKNIKKIAMPTIACGLDGLNWDKVSQIIKEVLKNTDIEILVCKI